MKKNTIAIALMFSAFTSSAFADAPCGGKPGHRHENGGGFVADTATVSKNATVNAKASVCGYATVSGEATIGDFAEISGNALVDDHAWVRGHAKVTENAQVLKDSFVGDYATISGQASLGSHVYSDSESPRVTGSAVVTGNAKIKREGKVSGSAIVDGNGKVEDFAEVTDNAHLSGDGRVSCRHVLGGKENVSYEEHTLCGSGRDATPNTIQASSSLTGKEIRARILEAQQQGLLPASGSAH